MTRATSSSTTEAIDAELPPPDGALCFDELRDMFLAKESVKVRQRWTNDDTNVAGIVYEELKTPKITSTFGNNDYWFKVKSANPKLDPPTCCIWFKILLRACSW
jgi:hypothetical protein